MICTVPPYRDEGITEPVEVRIVVENSSGKLSEPQVFTYTPGMWNLSRLRLSFISTTSRSPSFMT